MLKLLSKSKKLERSCTHVFTAAVFAAFHYFFVTYINSTFLATLTSRFWIGILYAIAAGLTIYFLLKLPKAIEKNGLFKTLVTITLWDMLALFVIGQIDYTPLVLLCFIIHNSVPPLLLACLDTVIEDSACDDNMGKTRGIFLTVLATASVISPLVIGGIIAESGFKSVYLYSLFFISLFLIVIFINRKKFTNGMYSNIKGFDSVKEFWSIPDVRRIGIANFSLHFFFSWMIIYMPIYLSTEMGFTWAEIGTLISITLLPFMILEIPAGEIADRIGEKKMLIAGMVCMIISSIIFPILSYGQLVIWTLVILFGRTGASVMETMIESYFFKKCKGHDELISVFRMTQPGAFIIAPLIGSITLIFVPFRFIFPILGIVLLIAMLFVVRIRDTK